MEPGFSEVDNDELEEEENDKIILSMTAPILKLSNINIMLPKVHHNISKYKVNRCGALNNLNQ